MLIYIIIYIILLSVCCIAQSGSLLVNRFKLVLTGLFFTLFSGLRWERGTDWNSYYSIYQNSEAYDVFGSIEPGFMLLNKFAFSSSVDYTVFLLLCALVIFSQIFYFIYKYSPNPQFSVFCLWCLGVGVVFFVRQTIALSILLSATHFLLNNKHNKFFLLVLLACMFHVSALIFLIAWPLRQGFNYKASIACVFIVTIVGVILITNNNNYLDKLLIYTDANYNEAISEIFDASPISIAIATLNRICLILIFYFFLYGSSVASDFFIRMFVFGTVVYIISEMSFPILGRFVVFFDVFQIILIPSLVRYPKSATTKFFIASIVVFYLTIRYWRALSGAYWDLYIPYNTFFTKNLQMIVY